MALLTKDNLIKTLEAASINSPHKAMMQAIGAAESTCYLWRNKSIAAMKANDRESVFYLEWNGQSGFWHQLVAQARINWIEGYEAELRHECRFGREEVVLGPDQQIVYRLDEELLTYSDDDLVRLLGRNPGDRYLRDENGALVPLTKTVFPSAQIRLRVLEQDRRYLQTQNLDVNVAGRVVHEQQAALPRPAGAGRPDLDQLRAMLAERQGRPRSYPTGPVDLGAPRAAYPERGDHASEQPKPPERPALPHPRSYQQPLNERHVHAPPRPSYAKPVKSLDQQDGTLPSEGRFKIVI